MWIGVGGGIEEAFPIKDNQVGEIAGTNASAFFQFKSLSASRRDFRDCVFQYQQRPFLHVIAKKFGKRPVSTRMRLAIP